MGNWGRGQGEVLLAENALSKRSLSWPSLGKPDTRCLLRLLRRETAEAYVLEHGCRPRWLSSSSTRSVSQSVAPPAPLQRPRCRTSLHTEYIRRKRSEPEGTAPQLSSLVEE